jgi:hypothetical protein
VTKHCALCGRVTLNPAVMIGVHPVGPKCARRAGLIEIASRKSGVVFPGASQGKVVRRDARTLDMFEVAA